MKDKERIDKWSYPPFNEWIWKSYDNTKVVSLDEFLAAKEGCEFFIGTDSQTEKNRCTLTTALIAYKWGNGGNIICHTQKVPKFFALRQKLLAEAMRSIETAYYVQPRIKDSDPMVIHLDVNANTHWESGKYREELVGFIVSQGFSCNCKPNAWGASKASDRRCRK